MFGLGAGVEIVTDPDGARSPADHFHDILCRCATAAIDRGAGLVVTLDEIHSADPDELRVVAAVLQEHVPDNWPLVVAIAALPSLRATRGKRALPTYLERAEWHELGPLTPGETRTALTEPAAGAGRPMTTAAAEALIALTGGYPYAIQVAGHFAWRASAGATQITLEAAHRAEPRITEDLEHLFRGRWDGASLQEREYLLAMAAAEQEKPPTGRDVAERMSRSTPQVAYLRDRLIKKGTIYAAADGTLHFITPGMGRWLRQQGDQ
ncbi:MAG: hypothetical protein V9G19_25940 [Tetrasphaera sp.]